MEGEKEFKPIDLTEENVKKLYEICKVGPDTKDAFAINIIESDTSGKAFLFDKDAVKQHQLEIAYLFGQLAVVQEKQEDLHSCKLVDVVKKYNGSIWTRDTAVLLELLHLGAYFNYAILIHKIDDTHIAVLNTNLLPPPAPRETLGSPHGGENAESNGERSPLNGKHPMNEPLKTLVSRVKEKDEILAETIQIELWQRRHGKAFREKNKHSKLVNPDVIRINRDAAPRQLEQPEPHWTEEELQEIERSLRAKAEEYARSRSQAEQKP